MNEKGKDFIFYNKLYMPSAGLHGPLHMVCALCSCSLLPPVGLTSADDVTEGFPLDLFVPPRAFQGNHRCMLDKTSKTLVKL